MALIETDGATPTDDPGVQHIRRLFWATDRPLYDRLLELS